MKEIYSDLNYLRRRVFAAVAKLAYDDGDLKDLNKIVYDILPGEDAKYRTNIFLERAIIGERLRLALGLPVRRASDQGPIDDGIEKFAVEHRVFEPPLVNVISFACMGCPEKTVYVTDNCRHCLGHPCVSVCPKSAVTLGPDRAVIDHDKCIKCRRCISACPYSAIIQYDRPCAVHCGVNAISSDHMGRAQIDEDKCVSCGKCIIECPFGAISDKSQMYQLIRAIKKGENVVAIVAPSFVGQFGTVVTPEQVFEGIRQLGLSDVVEVGLGADFTTLHEANEYLDEVVHGDRPFMGTSCCNSWALMVEKLYPELQPYISESATPMIATAYYLKSRNPDAKVVFIGPCISKKLEALRDYVKDYVDFVITFEELMGMFVAKGIELNEIEVDENLQDASQTARSYARSGGVAEAVAKAVKELDPNVEVAYEGAEGLAACVKMMKMAELGRKDGMLLEGMACENGCIGGPGTIVSIARAKKAVEAFAKTSDVASPLYNDKLYEYGPGFLLMEEQAQQEE